MNPLLAKSFNAGESIDAHLIVAFGSDDHTVVIATSASDLSIGVTDTLSVTTAEPVDVNTHGISDVRYGAAVTRGQRLTAGAGGRAVPVSSATDVVLGVAMVSGADGDIGKVKL